MENNGVQPPQQPNPQSPPQPNQPVMDIQPPRPAATSGWPSAAPAPTTGVGSSAIPTASNTPTPASGMASAPAAWGAPSVPDANSTSPAPSVTPSSPMSDITVSLAPSAPVAAPSDQPLHQDDKKSDQHDVHAPVITPAGGKHKAPMGVIIGAIAVALLLAAVAVFAYMKTQNSPTTPAKVNVPTIGASDVSETEKQLDDSLSGVDDSKDFATADLSDAALGL